MGKLPEKETVGDHAMFITKIVASMIPAIGGPALELLGLVNTPLETRKTQWFNEMAERINRLEDESISKEKLMNNPEFITVFIHASQIAIRNHEQEKLDALKNAIVNTARNITISNNMKLIFLSYIDNITPWHIKILHYFSDPKNACITNGVNLDKYSMGGATTFMEEVYPELRGKREFYDLIYQDLEAKGLTLKGTLHATTSSSGMLAKRTTNFGDEFLSFVS
ncbi:MAG: hypothetical protein V4519_00960 [Patescibacteria group bacterium]